jgi:hypothetical protein
MGEGRGDPIGAHCFNEGGAVTPVLLWRVDGLRVAWQVGALRWVTGHVANDNAQQRGRHG